MNFDFTEHQSILRDSVRDYARRELGATALQRAHSDDYPWDVALSMAQHRVAWVAR